MLRRWIRGLAWAAVLGTPSGCERERGGEAHREGTGAPDDATTGQPVTQPDTGFYQELSWAPDGSGLLISVLDFVAGGESITYRIYQIGADGSGWGALTDGPLDYWTSWSPDGSKIVFASRRDGNLDVHVMNADGTDRVRLTDHPADDTQPDWSPDGSRIVFVSARGGRARLYVMNADGSAERALGDTVGEAQTPDWSPDGSRIAFFASFGAGDDSVRVIAADGSNPSTLAAGVWPSWSADGSHILFGRAGGLHLIGSDGTGEVEFLEGAGEIGVFSPDGTRVAHIAKEDGYVTVSVTTLRDGTRSRLVRRPAPPW